MSAIDMARPVGQWRVEWFENSADVQTADRAALVEMYKNRRVVRRMGMGVEQLARRDVAFTEFYRRELDQQVRRVGVLLRSESAAADFLF